MPFTTWSPSRLADYEQCPLMAKLKHLDKLCPVCFKGRLSGGYDEPARCDSCGGVITKSPVLERGTAIDKAMEKYLKSESNDLPKDVASARAREVAHVVRNAVAASKARIQLSINLDRDWRPTTPFSGSVWLRAKLDVLMLHPDNRAQVIDWKTGGVDKKTKAPRADQKYDDQLSIYTTVTLSAFPDISQATAALVFLDAKESPVVERDTATLIREDLVESQEYWSNRLVPMMNDDLFSPCASYRCKWCDYSNAKGGPCQF